MTSPSSQTETCTFCGKSNPVNQYCSCPKSQQRVSDLVTPEPLANTDAANPPEAIEDKLNKLLDSTFAYGVDWTEFRDKSGTDHEVATYATKIKAEMKAKLKETIQAIITTETTKAETKGIMYCYLMPGVTPQQQVYMEERLKALKDKHD